MARLMMATAIRKGQTMVSHALLKRINELQELSDSMYVKLSKINEDELSDNQYRLIREYLDDAIWYAKCAKHAVNDEF